MNKSNLLLRIITFPLIMIIALLPMLKLYFKWLRDWLLYGGEIVAYPTKNEKKMIVDIYNDLRAEKPKFNKETIRHFDTKSELSKLSDFIHAFRKVEPLCRIERSEPPFSGVNHYSTQLLIDLLNMIKNKKLLFIFAVPSDEKIKSKALDVAADDSAMYGFIDGANWIINKLTFKNK